MVSDTSCGMTIFTRCSNSLRISNWRIGDSANPPTRNRYSNPTSEKQTIACLSKNRCFPGTSLEACAYSCYQWRLDIDGFWWKQVFVIIPKGSNLVHKFSVELNPFIPTFFWLWQNRSTKKHSAPYWSNQPLLIFWHSGALALSPERQSARMSKN